MGALRTQTVNATSKQLFIWGTFTLAAIVVSVGATIWFQNTHYGWLLEAIPDANLYREQWQTAIDQDGGIQHPAVLHNLPETCLCRALTIKHAGQISQRAQTNGFTNYQLSSSHPLLGDTLTLRGSPAEQLSPIVVITNPAGKIAYVGAYSDGLRCNTGTSMVTGFISSPDHLPDQTVVGLDVKSCRCAAN